MQDFPGKATSKAYQEWGRFKGCITSSVVGLVQDAKEDSARPWVLCQRLK
jgi:hypothetical protein